MLKWSYGDSGDSIVLESFRHKGYLPEGALDNGNQEESLIAGLPPFLRTLVVTDGTVTKTLEAYFWEPVIVEPLSQGIKPADEDIHWLEIEKGNDVLLRNVRLKGHKTENVYAFASSIVNLNRLPASFRDKLINGDLGIGELIRDSGLETYREILEIGACTKNSYSNAKQVDNETPIDMVYRTYRIILNQHPAILITETFPLSLY
ncbi:chorismate--pyruvate lyase family protein [Pseudomonadota bacterium]